MRNHLIQICLTITNSGYFSEYTRPVNASSKLISDATTGGVLRKKLYLKILQNSQENNCARDSFLIQLQDSETLDSGTGVFL